jgi:hypothetical protein
MSLEASRSPDVARSTILAIPASTLRASTSGAGGGLVLPGAQSSSRAKPSASLMRRTRVAMSGASHVSAART